METQLFVAGGLGGVSYWLATYPLDMIKTRIQADSLDPAKRQYKGFLDAYGQIARSGGTSAFFRGFAPCMIRAFPANAVWYVCLVVVCNVCLALFVSDSYFDYYFDYYFISSLLCAKAFWSMNELENLWIELNDLHSANSHSYTKKLNIN